MPHVQRSIRIEAPVEVCFEIATAVRRFVAWWPNLREVRNPSAERLQPGVTYDWTYNFMGLTFRGTEEALEVVPNERYTTTACAGQIEHTISHRFRAAGDATVYELEIDYALPVGGLLGRLADGLFVRRFNRKEADKVVLALKSMCEAAVVAGR